MQEWTIFFWCVKLRMKNWRHLGGSWEFSRRELNCFPGGSWECKCESAAALLWPLCLHCNIQVGHHDDDNDDDDDNDEDDEIDYDDERKKQQEQSLRVPLRINERWRWWWRWRGWGWEWWWWGWYDDDDDDVVTTGAESESRTSYQQSGKILVWKQPLLGQPPPLQHLRLRLVNNNNNITMTRNQKYFLKYIVIFKTISST